MPLAYADDFNIRSAEVVLINKVFHLNADIDYQFTEKALEALEKGVPLTLRLDIEIVRARRYLWDEEVATLEQRYQIQSHALTKQYLVTNLNSGSQHSLPTRQVAITVLGTVVELPLLDKKFLEPGVNYFVNIRASLDIESLPVPIRMLAYVLPAWHMSSQWYQWPLRI